MVIVAANLLLLGYGTAAAFGLMPARPTADGTIAVATWVFIATAILFLGVHRIRHADYASSRRNAHRVNLTTPVELDGRLGTLLDLSVGGGAIELDSGEASALTVGQEVQMTLAGAATVPLRVVRTESRATGDKVSLKVARGDWATARVLSLWLFHTPGGLLPGLPLGVPAVAVTCNA
jgi:cellulose synthase (UDP-forming)